MPGAEEFIVQIGVSGQDDGVRAFGQIGRAAEEVAKQVADAFGPIGKIIGGVGAAVVGTQVAFGIWAKHASEAANSLSNLAAQAGETVESISAMQSAMAAMGGSAETLGTAFRRMSQTIQNEWRQIVRESRDSKDKQIADTIAVGQAQNNLFNAQEKHRQAMEKLGVPTGPGPTEFEKRNQAIKAADLDLEQARLAARQAQKKADEDRLNDINNVSRAVQNVAKGEQTLAEAGRTANLEVGNVVKGLVATAAAPDVQDRLQHFTGNFNELATMGPKVKEVLYTFADFVKNAKDPTLEQAAAVRLFGRSLDQNMLTALRQGSDALKENEAHAQQFGLVMTGPMVHGAEEFHRAYNRLTSDLSTSVNQFGAILAPAFTPGMEKFTEFLEENHKQLLEWAKSLEQTIKPAIDGFFNALQGLIAEISGLKLDPETDAGKWQAFFQPAIEAATQAYNAIKAVVDVVRDVYKAVDEEMSKRDPKRLFALKNAEEGLKAIQQRYNPPEEEAAKTETAAVTDQAKQETSKLSTATQANTEATRANTSVVQQASQGARGFGVAEQNAEDARRRAAHDARLDRERAESEAHRRQELAARAAGAPPAGFVTAGEPSRQTLEQRGFVFPPKEGEAPPGFMKAPGAGSPWEQQDKYTAAMNAGTTALDKFVAAINQAAEAAKPKPFQTYGF